jgi:TP901 family phage tail tape measure protein
MPDAPVTLPVQLELDPSAPARLVNQINAVSSQVKPVRIPYDGAPLGRITGDLRDLDRSLAASNARVIAFGATTGVLFGVAEAFRGLVRTTIDVEKELTNIQSILHVSNQGFGQLKSSLFDIAGATATSFKQVAEVAANFARQGLGLNETLKRTRDALILARETGIDAKAAFTDLTAAVNTFQREALDSTTIINKLVAVSTSFAVTSGDLAEGIKRAGATAQAAKVDFDQLVGAITAIQQATGRGGGVAGTALQRIFARIESAPTLKALEDVKVKTRDLNGAVLPAIEILQDLAQKFKGLDDVQRSQVSQALAGRVQFNQLNALLRDYARENSVAAQATQRSANATDEAIKRNNELNTSLSALINKTKESGAALASAFGDKTVGPALRSLLNLLNKGLDFGRSAQGSDSLGAKIGSGIVDGIGTALKGPGFVILSAVILALFKKVGGAAIQAVGELSGITGHVKEQETLQASINRLMVTGNKEIVQRLQTTTDVTKQQEFLNQLIAEENAKLIIQRGLQADLAALASRTYRGGAPVVGQQGVQLVPKASGYIPNASEGMLESLVREKQAVQRGTGGASPAAQPVVIRDFNFGGGQRGPVVANNNEYIVKNFGGGTGSAIFNPQMIARMGGLGQLFGMGSVERVASGGFIPNYAKANLNIWEQMEKNGH